MTSWSSKWTPMVGQRGRGRFLEEAARERLERLELESAIREGAGLLRPKDYPHWRNTEAVKQWVRMSRGASS